MRAPAWLLSCLLLSIFACEEKTDEGEDAETDSNGDGDATDDGECMPPGVYGNCVDGGDAACQAEGQLLCPTDSLDNPSLGVCSKHCADVCDCWAAPATGTAEVACLAIVAANPDQLSCVLDCGSGQTCPDGMECLDTVSFCVWPAG